MWALLSCSFAQPTREREVAPFECSSQWTPLPRRSMNFSTVFSLSVSNPQSRTPNHLATIRGNTSITTKTGADPRVIVSGEGGVDFVVKGKGTTAHPNFFVAKCKITIEKTEVVSSLSVESMILAYSQDGCRWCESFSASVHESGFSLLLAVFVHIYCLFS
jgi:hypothetical protein